MTTSPNDSKWPVFRRSRLAGFEVIPEALVRSEAPLALLPVKVAEPSPPKRGEPVAVYLRSGHIVKVGRGFDEDAFARVVTMLEGA